MKIFFEKVAVGRRKPRVILDYGQDRGSCVATLFSKKLKNHKNILLTKPLEING